MDPKILELDQLAEKVRQLKQENKKIVHCHGVFDLLHVGHIRHFKAAKQFGDVLIVTVTQDKYVNKGPYRPAFTENIRTETLAALDCVDYVAINKWPTAVETIGLLKPDIYTKGMDYSDPAKDYSGGILTEKEAITQVGGEIIFTNEITFSSSNLINRYLHIFPKEVNDYIIDFSKKYSQEEIIKYLDGINNLKILVIGEAIIDEYQYGESIGKAGKEPIIALKYLKTEKFAGGILAIANQIANFCDNVDMFTLLGEVDSQEAFISQNLNKKINKLFHYRKDSPTLVKRRFLETSPLSKLLEFYIFNDDSLEPELSKEIQAHLEKILPSYDLVIVADFGHELFNKEIINLITKKSRFIAVNTQSNAGNMGYNTISKYPRADYICIDEPEIRLDSKDKSSEVTELIPKVAKKLSCKKMVLTRGRNGCIAYSNNNITSIPAFSEEVLDTMGAGDALLSITSPLVANDVPMEIVGFVGNAVGAMACMIIGNKQSIDKVSLYKFITSLMK
ncbi:MAG: PfkB family carbohydrate kinase [Methanocellales archaeon]|nr:PfkB family carbohydrate kinase [Methanocellales archaeon]MDD4897819.1 PfkB family carbohydrate kinase [Methanocellales archaeon]MDD5446400.1 PfkB family carbohydrate kinase [Methanocellales archaeon]